MLIPTRWAPTAANSAARSRKWQVSLVQPAVIAAGYQNSTTGPWVSSSLSELRVPSWSGRSKSGAVEPAVSVFMGGRPSVGGAGTAEGALRVRGGVGVAAGRSAGAANVLAVTGPP